MKKKILIIITFLIAMIITSIASAYAANYLYNSNEVYYDNSESNITSSDVQGAIDELYTEATNYSSINTRVTSLETLTGTTTLTTTNKTLTGAVNELNSSMSVHSISTGDGNILAYKMGKIVFLSIGTANAAYTQTTAGWHTIVTLPADLKPQSYFRFSVLDTVTDNYVLHAKISSTGVLDMWFDSNKLTIYPIGSIMYFTN